MFWVLTYIEFPEEGKDARAHSRWFPAPVGDAHVEAFEALRAEVSALHAENKERTSLGCVEMRQVADHDLRMWRGWTSQPLPGVLMARWNVAQNMAQWKGAMNLVGPLLG